MWTIELCENYSFILSNFQNINVNIKSIASKTLPKNCLTSWNITLQGLFERALCRPTVYNRPVGQRHFDRRPLRGRRGGGSDLNGQMPLKNTKIKSRWPFIEAKNLIQLNINTGAISLLDCLYWLKNLFNKKACLLKPCLKLQNMKAN